MVATRTCANESLLQRRTQELQYGGIMLLAQITYHKVTNVKGR